MKNEVLNDVFPFLQTTQRDGLWSHLFADGSPVLWEALQYGWDKAGSRIFKERGVLIRNKPCCRKNGFSDPGSADHPGPAYPGCPPAVHYPLEPKSLCRFCEPVPLETWVDYGGRSGKGNCLRSEEHASEVE